MFKKHILSAAIGIILLGGTTLKADLFLTVNGFNPAISPYSIQETNPVIITVDGNTPYEPNDITVTAEKGTLSNISDANYQYYIDLNPDLAVASISLTANKDMTIDTRLVPKGTTIYKLYLLYKSDDNTRIAIGIGLEGLIAVEEFYKEQIQPLALESIMDSNDELSLDEGSGEGGEESGIECIIKIRELMSDITTNRIWTATCRYYIMDNVNIRALLVIEPGTTIQFAPNTRMVVKDGGTLISCGTPDKPIIYTSDSVTPNYGDYNCPLQIEETASASTKLTYNYIEYANTGIMVFNKRLDNPIENNYFYHSNFGIREYGIEHTDIINNLIEDTYNYGIDANMASVTGEGSADSRILIANNTCNDCNIGIIVRGVANSGDAGEVTITNNIVSNSRLYGLALVNGYMYYDVANTGYYNNAANTLYVDSEYNPVYETANPYITGTGTLPGYYLRQDCTFINKSDEYIEHTRLIGKTTAFNGLPDSNKADLGFHYPNWDYSSAGDGNALMMDLNGDLTTDFYDFTILANNWRTTYNLNDMKSMADEWLKHSGPNIQIQISGDSNTGYIEVGATGWSQNTMSVFLLANGGFVRDMFGFRENDPLKMDISELGNGQQQLKVVSVDSNSRITCSHINSIILPKQLYYCFLPETYVKNQTLPFAAYNPETGGVTVRVYANGGSLVWSQNFSGNTVIGSIPAGITNSYNIDYVSFDVTGGASIQNITDPVEPPHIDNILALIVLPDSEITLFNYRTIAKVQAAFEARGIDYAKLSGKRATYNNVAWYARNKTILYLFINAHGHYKLNKSDGSVVLRTNTDLYDGKVVSIKRSDYINPNNAPPWCVDLGNYWETKTNSFAMMGFYYLEFAYFESCYSGHLKINASNQLVEGQPGQNGVIYDGPYSDISFALGIEDISKDRIYQGWFDKSWVNPLWSTEYQEWTQSEWYRLGQGDSLYDALDYVIMHWDPTSDPNDPVNAYRIKGLGDLTNIFLRTW
jgi:hypothetical protein